jgi:homoserine kinase
MEPLERVALASAAAAAIFLILRRSSAASSAASATPAYVGKQESKQEAPQASPSGRTLQERYLVTVRVPATTANLGPGYDVMGMALDIWSELTVERSTKFSMVCEGEGAAELPR